MKRAMLVAVVILASQLAGYSQESKNIAPPRRLFPVFEERPGGIQVLASSPGGLALLLEYFGFDPTTKKSGPYSHSRFGSQLYGNSIVTSDRMGKLKRLQFGELLLTTTEENMAFVSLLFEEYKELSISSDYVVSPLKQTQAKSAPSATAGPSVLLYFDLRSTDSSGGKDILGILVLRRNGASFSRTPLKVPDAISKLDFYQLAALPLSQTGFPVFTIDKPRRTDDVVEWTVENDGKITHAGKVSFPVLATVPKIVAYGVSIADHPKK